MKQAITINHQDVEYAIETKAIIATLGTVYIYKQPTYDDILQIIYLGLKTNQGYTLPEFKLAVYRGEIYTSRQRKQFPISTIRLKIQARIRSINAQYRKGK
ncbi:MAG: hypothetical protein MR536_02805 [Prevotella sp.]|nr:hypothetical protein [Prevotella sp.]MDY3853116.1 hypothetical protein [Prevotella sp.]